jgi:hypothetical protein
MQKKPAQLTAAMQKTSVSDAVKMAAANFVLINITVAFWDGTAALSQAAKKAATDAGVSETDVRMYANILGKFGHARLREVNKHFRLGRTYIDGATTPYAPDADAGKQKRGDKMLGAMRYPEVVAAVATLNTNAFANLEDFLTGYEGYRERALSANLGDWAAEAEKRFPTVDDVRSRFVMRLSDPKPLPTFNANFNIPVDIMGKIVEQTNITIATQLECAKREAIDASLKVCEVALKQLGGDGARMHQSVIDNVTREAVKLKEIADGYDQDPRVQDIAKSMLKGIANVKKKEVWKENSTKKDAALAAAENTVNNLKRMQQAPPVSVIPDTSGVILPDLTANLI